MIDINIDNRTLQLDDSLADEIKRFHDEIFESGVYKEAKDKKADVIVDIGANVGNFSYYMYDQAKEIYAIEAAQENFTILNNFVIENKLTKIKPFHLAISDSNGEQDLYKNRGCGGYSLMIGAFSERVKTKTLASFIKENNIEKIDILKIDVESAETPIFESKDFAEVADRIQFIIGEDHGGNTLSELLGKYGFTYEATRSNSFIAYQ